MHGNRILIINNGARQTGQQWATDHAPEVDINESGNILVIKGADGVRYGSDALGGIIVMEQPPLAFGQEHPKGRIATFYGSNGHRYAATGSLEGTLPFLRNIAWRIQTRETALRHIICSTIPEPEDYTSLHLRDMTAGDYGSKEYTATSANRRE